MKSIIFSFVFMLAATVSLAHAENNKNDFVNKKSNFEINQIELIPGRCELSINVYNNRGEVIDVIERSWESQDAISCSLEAQAMVDAMNAGQ
ncbi:hypothetical protein BN863_34470 [Formosa agariphila KMM 3901]|uniref:TonB C-terminal domain-containing protein n=1 Tax=Formosa agariphila (strain DSM 15362 / KCTC 12365 / LMG 23005 / KMM 3901 / M-2Alg 35-1) TaxID=1347342 RepID=T2KSC1_FORAG|nr:hypothetical protein [Formosa agariphila]CDF81159.1 hypothetical protein BN863_34470 [Formosa agariphila KMM 3901]